MTGLGVRCRNGNDYRAGTKGNRQEEMQENFVVVPWRMKRVCLARVMF
jgi:hypothetical protein